jgi:hypothetical protein
MYICVRIILRSAAAAVVVKDSLNYYNAYPPRAEPTTRTFPDKWTLRQKPDGFEHAPIMF